MGVGYVTSLDGVGAPVSDTGSCVESPSGTPGESSVVPPRLVTETQYVQLHFVVLFKRLFMFTIFICFLRYVKVGRIRLFRS